MIESLVFKTFAFMMGISILTSKSGISIFGLLLLIISFTPKNFKLIKNNAIMWLVASLFPIAILTNSLSLAGGEAVMKVIQSWPWPLLAIPSAVIVARQDIKKWLIRGLVLGLILALGKAFWNFYFENHMILEIKDVRTTSFWDISRWGVFDGVSIVILFWYLAKLKKSSHSYMASLIVVMGLAVIALVLNGSRAPWVGSAAAIFILLFYAPRSKYLALGILALGIIGIFSIPSLRERVTSVVAIKSENGKITSTDVSNAGRLDMWKVALDLYKEQPWFGTGLEMAERPMREFLSRQTDEYRTKFTKTHFSYHDQHSTYLGLLVKMGFVFTSIFLSVLAFLTWKIFQNRSSSDMNWLVLSLMVFHLVVFVFYTSFDSYEMVSLFPILVWGNLSRKSLTVKSIES